MRSGSRKLTINGASNQIAKSKSKVPPKNNTQSVTNFRIFLSFIERKNAEIYTYEQHHGNKNKFHSNQTFSSDFKKILRISVNHFLWTCSYSRRVIIYEIYAKNNANLGYKKSGTMTYVSNNSGTKITWFCRSAGGCNGLMFCHFCMKLVSLHHNGINSNRMWRWHNENFTENLTKNRKKNR